MNDINKFNDQYLKCIITKYSSAINGALANSGALIVYHPKSEQTINKNYLYLGNEFLASGYGFSSEEQQKNAIKIVNNYDRTINALKEEDTNLYSEINKAVLKLQNEISQYVKSNKGNISDTVIYVNDQPINTKNMLLYGEDAKYQNLEVTNLKVLINNKEIDSNNNIYLPLGSYIKNIDVYIDYKLNDSGGIYKLEVIHNNLNYLGQNNNSNSESVVIKYDQDSNGNAESGTIHYKKIFTEDNSIYVTDIIENIISGFYIYVEQTPPEQYKNFPRLESMFGLEVKSTSNIVLQNKIEIIKNVNVIPTHILYYSTVLSYESLENNYLHITTNEVNKIDTINISLSSNNIVKSFYIAIPNIYTLDKLYVFDNNGRRYNWTGAVTVKYNVNMLAYNNLTVAQNKYYSKYNIYKIYAESGINSNRINIELSLINESYDVIQITNDNINRNELVFDYNNVLNDEEFNTLYWINGDKYQSNDELEQTLQQLANTCTM